MLLHQMVLPLALCSKARGEHNVGTVLVRILHASMLLNWVF